MEFGVFDHLDRNGQPLADFYEARLALTEAYDRGGIYAYHIAEHHSTPLGLAPSPGVFLSAVAQRTRSLRFGPLIYMLPLYHPLRLIEEICMLDQMSGGRLQLGVGHGISPIETRYYGGDPATAREAFDETLAIVLQGLDSEALSFAGKFHRFENVPMAMAPRQRPHPPLWYGVHSVESAERNARFGYNILTLDPVKETKAVVERYRATWRATHGDAPPTAKYGTSRFVVLAESDTAALTVARRAYPRWYASFHHLYNLHGRGPMLGARPADFDAVSALGTGVAGSPATVIAELRAQIAETGINYLVVQFAFGDMTPEEARRSVALFIGEVMPALRA